MDENLRDALATLERLAPARDRATDRDVRTITLTDDEALAVLDHIHALRYWLPNVEP